MDLKDAYQIVPANLRDHHLLGICWEGSVYAGSALPFDLCSVLKIFTVDLNELTWALHAEVYAFCFTIGITFCSLCFPIHLKQHRQPSRQPLSLHTQASLWPSTKQRALLGIQIDTLAGQLHLLSSKLNWNHELVQSWLRRGNCTYKDLESLLGHPSHAALDINLG